MANKELTAKVKLNISDAEQKLKKLAKLMGNLDKAMNGKSSKSSVERSVERQTAAVEHALNRQVAASERAMARQVAANERAAARKQAADDRYVKWWEKALWQQEQRELAYINRVVQADAVARQKQQQKKWAAFQREQEMYERQIARQEAARQREAALERARQHEMLQQWNRQHPILVRINRAWSNINNRVDRVIGNNARLYTAYTRLSVRAYDIGNRIRNWQMNQQRLNSTARTTDGIFNSIWHKVAGIATMFGGIMGMRVAIQTSDAITSSENRLNNLNNHDKAMTQEQMDKMYAASQGARTGYADMMKNVSKSMTLAPKAFQGNIDNAIRFQEIMAKSYTLGGASAAEQSSSMYQMIQALGSGVLQGDELRSLTEGAPLAAKQIEKYVQGVYAAKWALEGMSEKEIADATMSLKEMGSQGMITSEMLVAAIMSAGDEIDNAFEKTVMTFDQVWTNIKNIATKAFEPVLQSFNKALNTLVKNGGLDAITWLLQAMAYVAQGVANAVIWMAENWNWLKYILYGVAIAIGVVITAFAIYKGWLVACAAWNYALAAAAVVFGNTAALAGTAAQIAGNKAFVAWVKALWPLLAIIAIFAIAFTVANALGVSIAEWIGVLVGLVTGAIAYVWNVFVALVEYSIGTVNMWYNIFGAFWNFFANVAKDPIGSVIALFGDLADTALGVLEAIAKAMDAVFGGNLASTVSGWRTSLSGKIETAVEHHGNGSYEKVMDKLDLSAGSIGLERWAYGDAFLTGFDFGEGLANKIGGMLSFNKLPNPNDYDWAGAFDDSNILSGIKDDTSDISGAMQLTAEDLKYLRKLAELEWKKEFTTANITVSMDNSGATINNEGDLDGIVTKLSDKLREELYSTANGVYV